jgi:hypothetical protein
MHSYAAGRWAALKHRRRENVQIIQLSLVFHLFILLSD